MLKCKVNTFQNITIFHYKCLSCNHVQIFMFEIWQKGTFVLTKNALTFCHMRSASYCHWFKLAPSLRFVVPLQVSVSHWHWIRHQWRGGRQNLADWSFTAFYMFLYVLYAPSPKVGGACVKWRISQSSRSVMFIYVCASDYRICIV